MSRFNESQKELAYKYYISDVLYLTNQLNKRYYDLIHQKTDRRSAEEIILDTMRNGGLKFE